MFLQENLKKDRWNSLYSFKKIIFFTLTKKISFNLNKLIRVNRMSCYYFKEHNKDPFFVQLSQNKKLQWEKRLRI